MLPLVPKLEFILDGGILARSKNVMIPENI